MTTRAEMEARASSIKQMFLDEPNVTLSQLAERHDICEETVRVHLLKHGLRLAHVPRFDRKLPPDEVLVDLSTNKGMTRKQVAALYGVSTATIHLHVHRLGIVPSKRGIAPKPIAIPVAYSRLKEAREAARVDAVHANRRMPSARTLEQIAIDEPGITPEQLAERYSVSMTTVYRQLRRCGIKLTRGGRRVPPDVELRERLRTESLEDLAAEFDVSLYSIRHHSYRLRVDVANGSTARPLDHLSLPIRAIHAAVNRLEEHRKVLEITGNRVAIMGVTAEIEGLISLQSHVTQLEGAH